MPKMHSFKLTEAGEALISLHLKYGMFEGEERLRDLHVIAEALACLTFDGSSYDDTSTPFIYEWESPVAPSVIRAALRRGYLEPDWTDEMQRVGWMRDREHDMGDDLPPSYRRRRGL